MRRRPLFPFLLVFFFVGTHKKSSSATIIIVVLRACLVLRVPIVSSLGGGVSFLVKSLWGMYWTRNDADEKRTRRQRRKRTNNRRKSVFDETVRFARIETYILTCTYIYISSFTKPTDRAKSVRVVSDPGEVSG